MNKVQQTLQKQGVKKMALLERQGVEAELREINEQLKGGDPGNGTAAVPGRLENRAQLEQKRKRLEERLNQDDDLIPLGAEQNELLTELKNLEVLIKRDLPSDREQHTMSKKSTDYEKAVQKTVHHQKTQGQNIARWQEIKRRLEPDNPYAADTSVLYR